MNAIKRKEPESGINPEPQTKEEAQQMVRKAKDNLDAASANLNAFEKKAAPPEMRNYWKAHDALNSVVAGLCDDGAGVVLACLKESIEKLDEAYKTKSDELENTENALRAEREAASDSLVAAEKNLAKFAR